jgi:hypothetical protein
LVYLCNSILVFFPLWYVVTRHWKLFPSFHFTFHGLIQLIVFRFLWHGETVHALAAWSSGSVSACHRGDWSYGSLDRIPPGYRVVVFNKKRNGSFIVLKSGQNQYNIC